MKKYLLFVPVLALPLALQISSCGGVVLTAQTVPATLHAQWVPNPAAQNVTDYQLRLDGAGPVTVPLSVCTAVLCRTTFTVGAFGVHAVTVSARNLMLSSDPTSFQEGPQTAPLPFTLNQAPQSAPGTVQVTQ